MNYPYHRKVRALQGLVDKWLGYGNVHCVHLDKDHIVLTVSEVDSDVDYPDKYFGIPVIIEKGPEFKFE